MQQYVARRVPRPLRLSRGTLGTVTLTEDRMISTAPGSVTSSPILSMLGRVASAEEAQSLHLESVGVERAMLAQGVAVRAGGVQ